MIVLDASAAVDLLLHLNPQFDWLLKRLDHEGVELHAPHLIDVEVTSALRRHVAVGDVRPEVARRALGALRDMPVERYAHVPLLEPMWALRHRLTAMDAAYVALAEALDATLLTTDSRLGRAGLSIRVEAYQA